MSWATDREPDALKVDNRVLVLTPVASSYQKVPPMCYIYCYCPAQYLDNRGEAVSTQYHISGDATRCRASQQPMDKRRQAGTCKRQPFLSCSVIWKADEHKVLGGEEMWSHRTATVNHIEGSEMRWQQEGIGLRDLFGSTHSRQL